LLKIYRSYKFKNSLNLDFDDAYQYSVAKYYGLKIVTMNKDFEKIKDVEIIKIRIYKN